MTLLKTWWYQLQSCKWWLASPAYLPSTTFRRNLWPSVNSVSWLTARSKLVPDPVVLFINERILCLYSVVWLWYLNIYLEGNENDEMLISHLSGNVMSVHFVLTTASYSFTQHLLRLKVIISMDNILHPCSHIRVANASASVFPKSERTMSAVAKLNC